MVISRMNISARSASFAAATSSITVAARGPSSERLPIWSVRSSIFTCEPMTYFFKVVTVRSRRDVWESTSNFSGSA